MLAGLLTMSIPKVTILDHRRVATVCASAGAIYRSDGSPDAVSRGDRNVSGITVAPECRCSPDDRDDSYSQATEPLIAHELGGMWSPYDGAEFESLRESDIEHIVAISEAHDSGLCAAPVVVRRRFANALGNLTLATPALNRNQKGAKDSAEWQPEQNRCWSPHAS